jgi:competence protein ComEA
MEQEGQNNFLSKQSKRGILLLLVVCLVIAFTPRVLSWYSPSEPISLTETEIVEVEMAKKKFETYSKSQKQIFSNKKERFVLPASAFYPSKYSSDDWMKLGLSEKQASVVRNYCKRGVKDLTAMERIYVLPKALLIMIKDSLIFDEPKQEFKTESSKEMTPQSKVDLNSVSKEELLKIPGIGNYFADKIIEKRTALGGFCQINQLLEIYRFDEEKLIDLSPFLELNFENIESLNINKASLNELKAHPYINYNVANSIVKMRKQKNAFKNIEEIKESVLIDDSLFQRLKAYLSL